MGREITNPVRRHFKYDLKSNISTCLLGRCYSVVKGNHAANLQRHLMRWHPDAFEQLMIDKREMQNPPRVTVDNDFKKVFKTSESSKEAFVVVFKDSISNGFFNVRRPEK